MSNGRLVSNRFGDPEYRIELPESEIELRDFFAAQAIHCFQMNDVELRKLLNGHFPMHEVVAKFCYGLADAMLKERDKNTQDAATASALS